ncbi:MAG: hypothetical protein PHX21_07890 [bacterium]|nr:hypothetical protein [bacterium]
MYKKLIFRFLNIAVLIFFVAEKDVNAHVPEDQGQTLQFYSGWCTTPPVINANVTDAVNPTGTAISGTTPDEWDDAFCRRMTLKRSDGTSDSLPGYIYLMNDANFLYIGLVYYHDNSGNLNRIAFYFDQGVGGGSHDDTLTTNNENAVSSNRVSAGWAPWDMYWDGANWVEEGVINFDVSDGYYSDRFQWECKIPLTLGGEDLLVNGGDGINQGDEIGFLLQILRNAGVNPGDYYFDQTNMNTNNSTILPGWMDVRLGKPKKFMTFAATKNVNGIPTVDGNIIEDAWRGCYQRNIVLTNFTGTIMDAKLYGIHDPINNNIYVGLKVYDSTNNTNDYCQIYQEQAFPGPTSGRDFLLNDNQENSIRVTGIASTDRYWANLTRTWDADLEAADGQTGVANYSTNHWEYEFMGRQNLGQYDLDGVDNKAKLGVLVRYHDDPSGEDFYWDAAVNADYEYIDQSSNTNISVGWAYLQLGAPYLQIIHPEDSAVVEGTYPIDCYVEPVTPAIIDSVQYQVEGEIIWTSLERVAGTNYWSENWNTTAYTDGTYELRVRAIDSNGAEIVQIITITINNSGGVINNPPVVTITLPSNGDIVKGSPVLVQWTSTPQNGATLVSSDSVQIDGSNWINATTQPPIGGGIGNYNWNTTTLVDGSHIIRIKSIDNGDRIGYSDTRLVLIDNTGPQIEDIVLKYPTGQTAANSGDNIIISAYVTDKVSGVNSVSLNGTNLNGVAVNVMSDNGIAPDVSANDGIYSAQITITNASTGTVTYNINASDNEGNSSNVSSNAELDNTPPSITGVITLDPDIYYRNGETIHLRIQCSQAGLTLTGNFINIDNNYITGAENVADLGSGNYDITYTVTETNERANGSYNIAVTAYDGALNSATNGIILDLDNTSPPVTMGPSLDDSDDILNINDIVRATISDTGTGNHIIVAAEYFVDVVTMPGEGTPLNATDGAFDEFTEDVNATLVISGMIEGNHTVYVRGKDMVGNWGVPSKLQFKVDREGPVIQNVEIKYPTNQTAVKNNDQTVITALITDATTRVDTSTVRLDGANLNGNPNTSMHDDGLNGDVVANDDIYTAVVTISTGLNGAQSFTIRANDIVPNSSVSDTGRVILDNTAPGTVTVVVLNPPDPDNVYRNGETIHLRVSTNAVGYTLTVNFSPIDINYGMGAEAIADNLNNTYDVTYTISETNTRCDSTYTIWATVADSAGNINQGSVNLKLDNKGPITSGIDFALDPKNDNILNVQDTLIAFIQDTLNPVKGAEYFIDAISNYGEGISMLATDGAFEELAESVKVVFPIAGLSEGQHKVFVHGQDKSNEWGAVVSHTFTVDTKGPLIQNIQASYPTGQTAVRDTQLATITALITDATTRVDTSTVRLDGANLNGNPNTSMHDDGLNGDAVAKDDIYTAVVTISTGLNGAQPFTIRANDIVPNPSVSDTGRVMLDNTAPGTVTVVVLNPPDPDSIYRNGETIHLRVSTNATGYRLTANFKPIDINYGTGAEVIDDNLNNTYDITYTISETNTQPDSIYTIWVTVADSAGNANQGSIALILDNRGPRTTGIDFALDPKNDDILNNLDTLLAFVQDTLNPVKGAEYFIDAISNYGEGIPMLATDGAFDEFAESIKVVFPIASLTEGYHKVYLHGQDIGGEWGSIVSHTFIVDTTGPRIQNIQVTYPVNQSAVRNSQPVTITATITDATTSVDTSTVRLDGASLNGNPNTSMHDDGLNGDVVANDDIYTAVVTISTGLNGAQSFTIRANDIVPNSSVSDTGRVILDNAVPTFINSICGDVDKIYKNTDKVTITTKWNGIDYKITAGFINLDVNYTTGAENVVNNKDSTYTITYNIGYGNMVNDAKNIIIPVTAYDAVGNGPIIDSSYVIELDNTPPYFDSVDTENDNYADGDTIRIICIMDDTTYTLRCDLSQIDNGYNEGDETIVRQNNIYIIGYVISASNTTPDGSYDIWIYAKDIAGNEESQATSIELDNTSEPVIILRPQAGDLLKGDVIIDVSAPDDAKFVCFQISPDNGVNWYNLNGTRTPDTCTIDSIGSDGWTKVWQTANDNLDDANSYLIKIYAYDEMNPVAHLIAVDILDGSIVIDNSAPTLQLAVMPMPQKGDSLNGEVYVNEIILTGLYRDSISGVKEVIIETNNDSGDNINNSPILIPARDSTFSQCIKLIEGNNHIKVIAFDKLANICSETLLIKYIIPEICQEIGPEGGTIEAPDGTKLIIPQDALIQKTRICIRPVPDNELVSPTTESRIKLLKVAHDFTPNGIIFHKPVTMILPYTEADLDPDQDNKPNYMEDSISAFFFDGSEWLKISEPDRNLADNRITVKINHFTVFDLGVASKVQIEKAYAFWTKNPFTPTEGTTICFTLPEPGKVTLKIYDLAGDVVATIAKDQEFKTGENSLKWNGWTDFDRYIGSGIYIYILDYRSESKTKDITEKKPIGVMK